ncbi:hypothetical protein [Tropicimonas sp. IMCC6043]|uniref:hypothetical protein n=1 Tax=Tropicimonas sp. IMCC6043 TaxID=2510645 RepID=UPI0013EDD9BE|nr:hypothetical protein [Tropicimonas sp. IMCC6043]
MKSMKYELAGFAGLLGLLAVFMALPGGEMERETLKSVASGLTQDRAYGPR